MKSGSPIVATILLVAIAVLGGSILFVFAQGFAFDEQIGLNMQPEFDMPTHQSVLCKNTNLEKIEKPFSYSCP